MSGKLKPSPLNISYCIDRLRDELKAPLPAYSTSSERQYRAEIDRGKAIAAEGLTAVAEGHLSIQDLFDEASRAALEAPPDSFLYTLAICILDALAPLDLKGPTHD